jgi:ArsR family transcriptional regulator
MALSETEKSPFLILKSFSLAFGVQAFKALGDESRLRILYILLQFEELSITDLELILDFTQTKVARQMGVLKNARLVQSRRVDHWVLYRIKDEAVELLSGLLVYIEKEPQVQKDKAICEALSTNRELSVNKISLKQYKPVGH